MKTAEESLSKGARTRAALLEAAYVQFTARGYHGASMRSIAEAAGLAVGGIYNYFESKDAVFEAVVVANHPLIRILPELARAKGETSEALLRNAAQRALAELEQNPRMFNLLIIEMIECQGRHIPALVQTMLPQIASFTQRLQTLDADWRGLPSMGLLQLFVGTLIAYWVTTRMLRQAGLSPEALASAEQFIDVFLHGVRATPIL